MRNKEKESYIQAMLYVAKIDGIKREEELRVIRELAEKLNVENIEQKIPQLSSELFEGKELRDVLSHVHERTNKLALIYQLVVLAYADGTYSTGENDALRRICAILHIEFEKLYEILELVEEYQRFEKHVAEVLEI